MLRSCKKLRWWHLMLIHYDVNFAEASDSISEFGCKACTHETCNSLSDFKCRFPSVPSMATMYLEAKLLEFGITQTGKVCAKVPKSAKLLWNISTRYTSQVSPCLATNLVASRLWCFDTRFATIKQAIQPRKERLTQFQGFQNSFQLQRSF